MIGYFLGRPAQMWIDATNPRQGALKLQAGPRPLPRPEPGRRRTRASGERLGAAA
jgi:hypothetical protein